MRPLPPVHVLHEYRVELVREQFTEAYVIARDPEDAVAKATELLDELDWDDGDVSVTEVTQL